MHTLTARRAKRAAAFGRNAHKSTNIFDHTAMIVTAARGDRPSVVTAGLMGGRRLSAGHRMRMLEDFNARRTSWHDSNIFAPTINSGHVFSDRSGHLCLRA